MHHITTTAAPYAETFGQFVNNGANMLGELTKFIPMIPSRMHQNASTACTVFAVSNIAIYIFARKITNSFNNRIEHHPDQLSKEAKKLKPRLLHGVFGLAVYCLNLTLSKMTGYPLTNVALLAISVSLVAVRVVLNRAPKEPKTVDTDVTDINLTENPSNSELLIQEGDDQPTVDDEASAQVNLLKEQIAIQKVSIEEKKTQMIDFSIQILDLLAKNEELTILLDASKKPSSSDLESAQEGLQTQLSQQQQQISDLQAQVADLTSKKEVVEKNNSDLQAALNKAKQAKKKSIESKNDLGGVLELQRTQLKQYQDEVEKLNEEVKRLEALTSEAPELQPNFPSQIHLLHTEIKGLKELLEETQQELNKLKTKPSPAGRKNSQGRR